MLLKRFTNYLLEHRLQALAFTFLITFVPIIGVVGMLFAGLVTLVKGAVEGAIFTFAATLPYLISFLLTGTTSGTEVLPLVVWAAVGVAVFSNILTFIFGVMLLRQTSWSLILQIAALVGVLVVSVIHLVYPDVATWWGDQLRSYYIHAQTVTGIIKNPINTPDAQLQAINITRNYATGLMVVAILFNGIMQLIVARWWQAAIYSPGSLKKELHQIRLSPLAGFLFLVSLVFSYFGNSVISDIMPILYMLFTAAGLSLIHYFFGLWNSSTTWFWLSVLYVALIFSLPTSLVLISMIALIDTWTDLRKRFKRV